MFRRTVFRKSSSAFAAASCSSDCCRKNSLSSWFRPAVATWQRRGASLRFVSANARSTGNDEMALASKAVVSASWTGSEQSQLTMC